MAGNADNIDACALPAVQAAYISVLAGNAEEAAILEKLNGALASFGLAHVPNGSFARWACGVRSGKVHRPRDAFIVERMDIEGSGQIISCLAIPSTLNPALHGLDILQVRLVEYPSEDLARGALLAAKLIRWSELAGGICRLGANVCLEVGKFYSVFVTAVDTPRRCLAGLAGSKTT